MPFSLFTATCVSCRLPQRQSFFISWTQYSANLKCDKWSFVRYIVSFSGLKMVFSKLSQFDVTTHCAYLNFNLHFYFMSSIIERLCKSFSFINSVQIWLGLEILRNSWTIFRSSHRRCSIEKLFLKLLWHSQENTRFRVFFLLKLQAFWPLAVLKRGFNTYFLVNIGKFTRTLILKNSKQPTDVFCRKRCF